MGTSDVRSKPIRPPPLRQKQQHPHVSHATQADLTSTIYRRYAKRLAETFPAPESHTHTNYEKRPNCCRCTYPRRGRGGGGEWTTGGNAVQNLLTLMNEHRDARRVGTHSSSASFCLAKDKKRSISTAGSRTPHAGGPHTKHRNNKQQNLRQRRRRKRNKRTGTRHACVRYEHACRKRERSAGQPPTSRTHTHVAP